MRSIIICLALIPHGAWACDALEGKAGDTGAALDPVRARLEPA